MMTTPDLRKAGTAALLIAGTLLLAARAPAQFGDPRQRIREIADGVAKQMQEIDELLLRNHPGNAGGGGQATDVEDMLKQTSSGQHQVVDQIDELIQELSKMQGEGGGQQSGQPRNRQQQQGGDRGQQRRQQTPIDEGANPARPGGEQPQRDDANRQDAGTNKPADRPPEDPTEHANRSRVDDRWGDLPFYQEFLKTRGGAPEVPEKYRRFQEAFLKQSATKHEPPR